MFAQVRIVVEGTDQYHWVSPGDTPPPNMTVIVHRFPGTSASVMDEEGGAVSRGAPPPPPEEGTVSRGASPGGAEASPEGGAVRRDAPMEDPTESAVARSASPGPPEEGAVAHGASPSGDRGVQAGAVAISPSAMGILGIPTHVQNLGYKLAGGYFNPDGRAPPRPPRDVPNSVKRSMQARDVVNPLLGKSTVTTWKTLGAGRGEPGPPALPTGVWRRSPRLLDAWLQLRNVRHLFGSPYCVEGGWLVYPYMWGPPSIQNRTGTSPGTGRGRTPSGTLSRPGS